MKLHPTAQPDTTAATANGYVCFFSGKRFETTADSLYAAKLLAVAHFKPAKSKQHMVSVTLAETRGATVTHTPDF